MLRMIIVSLPVASVALGIVIAASVPILRDTYGASNFQTGVILALDALGIAIGGEPARRHAGYLTGWRCSRSAGAASGSHPNLLIAAPLIGHRRHRQRHRDRALPHDDAARDAAARARQHDRIRVRRDVQHDRASARSRSCRSRSALGQRATFTAAGTVFALGGLVAALAGRARRSLRRRRPRVSRSLPRAPPSMHDNHDYDKLVIEVRLRAGSAVPAAPRRSGDALRMGLGEALRGRRVLEQLVRRADRPGHQVAAAVRADAAEAVLGAVGAERALVGADARLVRCRAGDRGRSTRSWAGRQACPEVSQAVTRAFSGSYRTSAAIFCGSLRARAPRPSAARPVASAQRQVRIRDHAAHREAVGGAAHAADDLRRSESTASPP